MGVFVLCTADAFAAPLVAGDLASNSPPTVLVKQQPSPVMAHSDRDLALEIAAPLGAQLPLAEPVHRSLSMFFAIGMVINLFMLLLLSVWAYRQLHRPKNGQDRREPRQSHSSHTK